MVWEPGHVLQDGKYIIEEKLGEGGFGVTYLASDSSDSFVVIKTLNEKIQNRRNFAKCQQDFLNEALRLAKCAHPHIVGIHELIQEELLWCMVIEYIDGIDLATLVDNEGALPEPEALHYIQQIGDALCAVHRQGFLHRDIKPLNILLRADRDEAVLIDFGLAREFTPNLTQIHTEYISKGFAPIEQYDRRSLRGAYTDVYGLAATLYALLTAEIPEASPTRDRQINRHQNDPLVPPKQLNPEISDRVNAAILEGMALEPENRPQTIPAWFNLLGIELNSKVSSPAQISSVTEPAMFSPQWTSAVGMDYSRLRDFLAAGNWQEADRETAAIMLRVYGREKEGRFSIEDIQKFPCRDLRTIDKLWLDYSNESFSFSVQNKIWKSVEKNYEAFGEIVGWRRGNSWISYSELIFNLTAPEGHLPSWGRRGRLWSSLAKRIEDCGL
ncbi:serine/threonine-protein kinase [Microcoleus sp. FACHB-68]|uniref:serine/threonine-protein kinase n=1 Tax=Microcoleus sp. FACHB-68 TaxID=2692826 RepID=UPI001682A1DC|nr:serine/threonine-protein kinase [Microcoleus sp. FACHB-68]MBD1939379.1 GUN4 domain-containing protein [Microcoleus sp. FACHB-68]